MNRVYQVVKKTKIYHLYLFVKKLDLLKDEKERISQTPKSCINALVLGKMEITIRSKVYKIVNATDYHFTMITAAMDGAIRRPKQDSDIAYVIKSCCPELAADGLVSYRHITHADDSEETEFKQGLNTDEVAIFVAGLSLQIIADRVVRLKSLNLTDDQLIATRAKLVQRTEEALAGANENIEKLKVTVLLGGVELEIISPMTVQAQDSSAVKLGTTTQELETRHAALLKELQMMEAQLAASSEN